jgi:hypothetical protein
MSETATAVVAVLKILFDEASEDEREEILAALTANACVFLSGCYRTKETGDGCHCLNDE